MSRPVDVAELKRAWDAVQAGQFAHRAARGHPMGTALEAAPPLLATVVVGVAGGVGASTVALALAEASGAHRLVDCAPAVASGLVGVCDTELGLGERGWRQGRRGDLLVQRSPIDTSPTPEDCPTPPVDGGPAIVDLGWDAVNVLGTAGWIPTALTDPAVPLVIVTRCTIPLMRRLSVALDALQATGRDVRVAVVGMRPRTWPRTVPQPETLRHLADSGRVIPIPEIGALTVRGLDSRPLPRSVLIAATNLIN